MKKTVNDMLSKNLFDEVVKMAIGVFSLSAIMVIVFALLGYFDMKVIWGALLGSTGCVLNYAFLAFSVQNVVKKEEKSAKGYMGISYILRMLFIAAVIILAIKIECFNYIAAVIPFFFTRIVIMIFNMRVKKGGEKN